jgi:hypothetical protein
VNAYFTKLKKRSRDHKLKKKHVCTVGTKKKRTAETPGFVSLIIVRIINQTIAVK